MMAGAFVSKKIYLIFLLNLKTGLNVICVPAASTGSLIFYFSHSTI